MGRDRKKTAAIICHGYQAHPIFMTFVKRTLRKSGFFDHVVNLQLYNSWFGLITDRYSVVSPIINVDETLEISFNKTLVERVFQQLREQLSPEIDELHFLVHSMGGLVIRSLLKAVIMPNPQNWLFDRNSPSIGSVIQLATPNNGTKITTMRVVQWLDQLRMAYYFRNLHVKRILHLLKHKIDRLLGVEANGHMHEKEFPTSQLEQMKPDSLFLQWLNSYPTFTDTVPHYVFIGTKNSFHVTDYIWKEIPTEYFDDLDDHKTPNEHELMTYFDSDDTNEPDESINLESLKYENPIIIPNDGVVSIPEATIAGGNMIDMGEHADHITHNGIISWFLPDKHHQFVKNKVLEIYRNLLEE
ncbi:MAG: esterase/lipase family protein [Candidatus Kariarchaeaceae archaeon]|jgi:triacylglycerol esterase/lipase EstA (alpha/beta hydrolase family)